MKWYKVSYFQLSVYLREIDVEKFNDKTIWPSTGSREKRETVNHKYFPNLKEAVQFFFQKSTSYKEYLLKELSKLEENINLCNQFFEKKTKG